MKKSSALIVFLILVVLIAVVQISSFGKASNNTSLATGLARHTMADGVTLFGDNCAKCHGKDGKGFPGLRAKGQPDFTDVNYQKSRTDAQLAAAIRGGEGKLMPAFKDKLSSADITALVARVRAFGKH
ncbi:MAG TPA: c-type cytochrome [Blastocatellia bacterium]|nr:c-type cytochrome [Blastocatellia bacterium]